MLCWLQMWVTDEKRGVELKNNGNDVCVWERERERSLGYATAALRGRDKTTAYTEACFLGIWKLSPKSTGDTQHHPSPDYNVLTYPPNCLTRRSSAGSNGFCWDAVSMAGVTRVCLSARVCAQAYELRDDHRRAAMSCRSVCMSVLLCDSERRASSSWPPPYAVITSYQSGAARSHGSSSSSHIPTQLSTLPPLRRPFTRALIISLSFMCLTSPSAPSVPETQAQPHSPFLSPTGMLWVRGTGCQAATHSHTYKQFTGCLPLDQH